MSWQLQDAKNRFSEVVEKALTEGPQRVTRRGRPAVVVIAEAEYEKLRKPGRSFVEHLLAMPKVEIEFERVNPPSRDVDL
ncbi:type II toxin-antitoxin system Phd/YefM family antitoxin [Inquilinus limosus]|uniref:type II toxin-antitoxin system Phd/YefM family antitoxin n=1 Tax=Inquilinus limosus TaxID=171674 RepID=UPI0003FA08F9|nr:type II toxin-antitoxin system Phd/YefM family antitoxin [Inquilinus limosus]